MKPWNRPKNGARVVLVEPFPVTSQVALAAQLRLAGYRVVSMRPHVTTRTAKARMAIDRLVFHEVWPLLEGCDESTRLTEEAAAMALAAPTVDIHAFDSLASVLAGRRESSGSTLRAGLAPEPWYDKRWMADRLVELGIPGPRVWDAPVSDEFPVIVKSRATSGGMGVRICSTQAELDQAWADLGGDAGLAFVQEHLAGPTYSITGVAQDGEVLLQEIYRMITNPATPTAPSTHQEIVDRPDLGDIVRRVIKDMGYSGIFNIQQIVDAQGRGRVFDVNPRCPGSFSSMAAAESMLFPTYLAVLEGATPPAPRPLATGTITSSIRLSSAQPWESTSEFLAWYRETGKQVRLRRRTHGSRFVLWAYVMRLRLVKQGLSATRLTGPVTTEAPGVQAMHLATASR